MNQSTKIIVAIRKRPLSKKEIEKKDMDIIEINNNTQVTVRELKYKVDMTKYTEENSFNFDHAFDDSINNQEMYKEAVKPMVQAFFNKAKVTVFAYGQTGSGKTYTMMGDHQNPQQKPGLYLLAAQDIFALIKQKQNNHLQLYVSFYEIYCSKLFDLLNQRQLLVLREDAKQNVNIVGLTERKINDIKDLMTAIQQGMSSRMTSTTSKNDESSRSHAILQISLIEESKLQGKKLGGAKGGFLEEIVKNVYSKISFIDLAGSERAKDVTDMNKKTRIDGAEINKSLLALKECIRALDQSKSHKPFRGSKLTQVLKDSLTGNCRTLMIGNVSPNLGSSEDTLNTLRYSDRVKELKNQGQNKPKQTQQIENNWTMDVEKEEESEDNYDDNFDDENEDEIDHIEDQNNYELKQQQQNAVSGLSNIQQKIMNNQNKQTNFNPQPQNQFNNLLQPIQSGYNLNNQNQQNQNDFHHQLSNNQNGNPTLQTLQNLQNQNQNFDFNIKSSQNLYNQQQISQKNSANFLNLQQVPQGNNDQIFQQFSKLNQSQQLYQNNSQSNNNQNQSNQNLKIDQIQQQKQAQNQQGLNQQNFKNQQNNQNLLNVGQQNQGFLQQFQGNQQNQQNNQEKLQILQNQHQKLINQIVEDEQNLIMQHHQVLNQQEEDFIKEKEMLEDLNSQSFDPEQYMDQLDEVLDQKFEQILNLKKQLRNIKLQLKKEKQLNLEFQQVKNQSLNIYELKNQPGLFNNYQL